MRHTVLYHPNSNDIAWFDDLHWGSMCIVNKGGPCIDPGGPRKRDRRASLTDHRSQQIFAIHRGPLCQRLSWGQENMPVSVASRNSLLTLTRAVLVLCRGQKTDWMQEKKKIGIFVLKRNQLLGDNFFKTEGIQKGLLWEGVNTAMFQIGGENSVNREGWKMAGPTIWNTAFENQVEM